MKKIYMVGRVCGSLTVLAHAGTNQHVAERRRNVGAT